jgi:hypothetical protein
MRSRNSGRSWGTSSQTPAEKPVPTPPKKACISSNRPLLAIAVLTTWASEPAPAGPISGRAEIRLVK